MNLMEAIKEMRNGKKIRRSTWQKSSYWKFKDETVKDTNKIVLNNRNDVIDDWEIYQEEENKLCFGCKSKIKLQKHHIVPKRIKGSKPSVKNTVMLCKSCHKIADLLATKYYEGVEIIKN